MFAPLVAKPKSAPPQRSAVAAQRKSVTRNAPCVQEKGADAARTATQEAAPSWDFSKIPVFSSGCAKRFQSPPPHLPCPIQPKLKVGVVNDSSEKEADSVADQVMRIPNALFVSSTAPQIGRKCTLCGGEEEKSVGTLEPTDRDASTIVHKVLSSPGEPLGEASRAYFEPRFGYDFSQVRVHSDSPAAASAQKINAAAYTSGRHVVFGEGNYTPNTTNGKKLLAHELVHVVQQRNGPSPTIARQEASFKEKASLVWHVGGLGAYRVKELATEALQAAQKTGLPGLHNGPADAWRHCYWNCRMTQVIGKDDAAFVAENHEEQADENPTAEHMMDSWNNEEGQNTAEPKPAAGSDADVDYSDAAAKMIEAQNRPAVDCDSACLQKLNTGKLWTLQDLGGGKWGGGVQSSKPASRAGTPSGEKYEKY